MKYYYKITLSYLGSRYLGFQIQAGEQRELTIQGQLNKALSRIAQSRDIHTLASGRTDAGVHAIAQVVRIVLPLSLKPDGLKSGMNALLPSDIEVREVELSDKNFHPVRDVSKKEYWYLFSHSHKKNPFAEPYTGIFPYSLNLKEMKEACSEFIGEHDFRNFYCKGSEVNSTVRKILDSEIIKEDLTNSRLGALLPNDLYCFRVVGHGFLKQMVRLMMGALVEIGRGKSSVSRLREYLSEKKDLKLGSTAPPQGLYLRKISF